MVPYRRNLLLYLLLLLGFDIAGRVLNLNRKDRSLNGLMGRCVSIITVKM